MCGRIPTFRYVNGCDGPLRFCACCVVAEVNTMSRSRRRTARSRSRTKVPRTQLEQLEGRRMLSGAPPNPIDHMVTIAEDSGRTRIPVITIDILNGDPPNDPLELVSVTSVGDAIGQPETDVFVVYYTPAPDFSGTDTFTYTVTDSYVEPDITGLSGTANISVVVTPVPDAPVANDDAFSGEMTVSGNVLLNDTDVDGDALTVETTPVTAPANGSVALNADGTFTYAPNAGFVGNDSFVYRVSDGGLTDTATATVSVIQNMPPLAVDDVFTVEQEGVLMGNVLDGNGGAADSDPEDDTLSVLTVAATPPGNGALTLNADGSFVYVPVADFSGTDSFGYTITDGTNVANGTVTITILSANDPPVANDDTATVLEDMVLNGNVLLGSGADSDPDGDPLTVSLVTPTTNGTVELQPSGLYTYTPNANFNGGDSFVYRVSDGTATDTATVTLTIAGVNDPPVANDDQFSGAFETPVTGNVLSNGIGTDTDIDEDMLSVLTTPTVTPAHGTVLLATNGAFTYTPNAGFSGSDSFEYTVTDGSATDVGLVSIAISPADNLPPNARPDAFTVAEDGSLSGSVLADNGSGVDSDPDDTELTVNGAGQMPQHGSLVLDSDGDFTYIPNPNFNGSDSFGYRLLDGRGGSSEAVVTISVEPVNDAPVAVNDRFATQQGAAVSGNVLATNGQAADSDVDMDALVGGVSLETPAANGMAVVNADGSFTYTPNTGFFGTDSFVYRVSDGSLSDTAMVTIEVSEVVNRTPVAAIDAFTIDEDTSLVGNVLGDNGNGADMDPDGDTLSAEVLAAPANGDLDLEGNGAFTYTPNANYNGGDSFRYQISDGRGGTAFADVNITVNPVNDFPVAQNDAFTVASGAVLSGDLLADNGSGPDVDPDQSGLTTRPTRLRPRNGIVVLNLDGTFEYTPNSGFSGTDRFSYTLRDAEGDVGLAFVDITIEAGGNQEPVARDDMFGVQAGNALSGNVLADNGNGADEDPDQDSLSVAITELPQHGEFTLETDGAFTYTPELTFSGTDQFVYSLSDGQAMQTATVTINVEPAELPSPVTVLRATINAGVEIPDQLESVAYEFSGDVESSIDVTDLVLTGSTGNVIDLAAANVAWNAEENVATWDLSSITLEKDLYSILFQANGVTDAFDQPVDGDGDGLAGGDVLLQAVVTWKGDANRNLSVDVRDFLTLSRNFNRSDATWNDGDFDGDGFVTVRDFLQLSRNFNKRVDVTQPGPAPLAVDQLLAAWN